MAWVILSWKEILTFRDSPIGTFIRQEELTENPVYFPTLASCFFFFCLFFFANEGIH